MGSIHALRQARLWQPVDEKVWLFRDPIEKRQPKQKE